jgi:hypothetical protein
MREIIAAEKKRVFRDCLRFMTVFFSRVKAASCPDAGYTCFIDYSNRPVIVKSMKKSGFTLIELSIVLITGDGQRTRPGNTAGPGGYGRKGGSNPALSHCMALFRCGKARFRVSCGVRDCFKMR